MLRFMLYFFLFLVLLAAGGWAFMQTAVFGADATGERLARIQRSPHYRDRAFQNPVPTEVMLPQASRMGMLLDFINKPADNVPPRPLPSVKTDLATLLDGPPTLVWFGHSSYLLKAGGVTFLVDPVLSGHASPVGFFGKAFAGSNVYSAADMPPVDALILSHDHYDHLDYETIVALRPKVKHYYVALGVGAHLNRWGIPDSQITEFDWNDPAVTVRDSVTLTAVPARHFSGRSFARGRSLWTAFVLQIPGYKLFLGGDSGYGPHFAEIGQQHGPFDLALLENGQYGKDWPNIHMFPAEVAQAAKDLGARALMPVHWAKFSLAYHPWNEPIRQLHAKAQQDSLPLATPRIGELVTLGQPLPTAEWWAF